MFSRNPVIINAIATVIVSSSNNNRNVSSTL